MKINKQTAIALLQLLEGEVESIQASKLPATIQQGFLDGGGLKHIGKNRRGKVVLQSKEVLQNYLKNEFKIQDLKRFVATITNPDAGKSYYAKDTLDAKYNKSLSSLKGFLVSTYIEVQGMLDGKLMRLKTLPGTATFIFDYQLFKVPEDLTVVGIENAENFRKIYAQSYLFESIKPLFVLRTNSKALVEWLQQNKNSYLHFGDFDLAGLRVYTTEFRNKLGEERCRFFQLPDMEKLLQDKGNPDLYNRHIAFEKIDFTAYPEIATLAGLIKKYKKGVEQERLIEE